MKEDAEQQPTKDTPPKAHPLVPEQRLKAPGYWHNGRRVNTRTPNRSNKR